MIIGTVNAQREATIPVLIRGDDGPIREIEAVIDTGFTGYLTLPARSIASLGLTWRGRGTAFLGDDSLHLFDVYSATIIWDEEARLVEIDEADTEPLVGMRLLEDYELRIQVQAGGSVILVVC